MDDKTIKLLYIDSSIRALININGAPAGETGTGAITQPIAPTASTASFFITMLPLENATGLAYLPYTRRICLTDSGTALASDGLIDLCIWPDNIVELTLYPLAIPSVSENEMRPAVLAPLSFYIDSDAHTAFIYNEACSSFAIEHNATSRLRFISPLPFSVKSADISFARPGDLPVIYATGQTTDNQAFIYAAAIRPTMHTAVCRTCADCSVDGSGISVVTEGAFAQERIRYENRDATLKPTGTSLGWFTRQQQTPQTAQEACAALLQAVRLNNSTAAMACLTPSLADGLAFDDLKEFFGDFSHTAPMISPACGQSGIALKYLTGQNRYAARMFCVETKQSEHGLLIDNLREP